MKKLFFLSLLSIFFTSNLTIAPVVYGQLLSCTPTTPASFPCLNPDGSIRPAVTDDGSGTGDGDDGSGTGDGDDGSGTGDGDGGSGTGDGLSETVGLVNPLKIDNIQDLLAVILSSIVQLAIPFLVLALMWVGFLFVAARGNPEKLGKAKQALFYTLLGALIILGAQTLSVILSGTIEQLTNTSQ